MAIPHAVGMKIVKTSERIAVLADENSREQFTGRYTFGDGTDVEMNERIINALGGNKGSATDNQVSVGIVGADGPREGNPCAGAISEDRPAEWIKSESRYFLIDAMTRHDDRLALFSQAVLRHMIEGEAHAATSGKA